MDVATAALVQRVGAWAPPAGGGGGGGSSSSLPATPAEAFALEFPNLTFSLRGCDGKLVELRPGGASLPVTFDRRVEWAAAALSASLTASEAPLPCPYDDVLIFHDAENCPLPQRWVLRDESLAPVAGGLSGRRVFADALPPGVSGGPFVHPVTRAPLGDIDGGAVFAEVLRRAIAQAMVACGAEAAAAARVDLSRVRTSYAFVLRCRSHNPFHPLEC